MLLSLSIFPSGCVAAEENDTDSNYNLLDPYNQMHFVGAYAFTLTETLLLEHCGGMARWKATLISFATTIALGAAKEYWIDPQPSKKDLYMDLAGSSAAAMMTLVFKF